MLTNVLVRGRRSGRKNIWANWIEQWLAANPGKTLYVARAARNASFILKRETDDFISVEWLLDGEVFRSHGQPTILGYDELADIPQEAWGKL